MKNSTKLGAGASLAFLASSLLAAPNVASAASVETCGDEVPGATLNDQGEYCELSIFGSGADVSWTVPAGLAELQGLLVGGGAGANTGITDFTSGWSYAGAGGSVSYVDLTATSPGTVLTLKVGAGGKSRTELGEWTAGGTTEIKNGATVLSSSAGGQGTGYNGCLPAGGEAYLLYVEEGQGAAGVAGTGTCFATGSTGIFPSTDPNSTSLFKDLTPAVLNQVGLGTGGVISWLVEPQAWVSGQGAGVILSGETAKVQELQGTDGAVVLRFSKYLVEVEEEVEPEVTPPTDVEKELADTGVSSSETLSLAGAAAVMVVVGTSALLLSRRRRNS